ncbi:hypothetical protein FOA52_011028 [Chlamydomonas sp. UWO 241]|nr:hypothetical protein FOA52_011028 [Chlamydomonas sp. UWO 241]
MAFTMRNAVLASASSRVRLPFAYSALYATSATHGLAPRTRSLRAPGVSTVEVPGVAAAVGRLRGRAPTRLAATASPAEVPPAPFVSFGSLGLITELQTALADLSILEPTEIQAKSIPGIMSGGDYVLASHTGSGKTLAYLLPIINLIKAQEVGGFVGRPKRPRALVLGPTKELTEQIAGVCKALSHSAKFRAVGLTGSKTKQQQKVAMMGAIDIVVATPTRFLQHVKEGNVFVKDISWLVVDEADTMLADPTWAAELKEILTPLRARPDRPKADVVLVSATMNKPIRRLIASDFPGVRMIETSSLHKGIQGSRHKFVRQPPGRDKLDLLGDLLAPDARQETKVLVFCNTVDSCRAVDHYCTENGVETVCYHGDMPVPMRQAAMLAFSGNDASSSGGDDSEGSAAGFSGRTPVMVATDVAARGLDFPGQIDLVINFDFPSSPIDYIHRAGRTARAGRTGSVSSIVTAKDRTLADRVEWALAHGESLDVLSSDKRILPPSQRPKPMEKGGRRGSGGRGAGRGAGRGVSGGRGAPKGSKGAARVAGSDSAAPARKTIK